MGPFSSRMSWIEQNFREVFPSAQVALDLKYASNENFTGINVYAGFHRCFLAPLAFERFSAACTELKEHHPHLRFLVWDTLRPRSVQQFFFDHLAGTPFQHYVAAPDPGSLHNFGMAMDLTLQTKSGEPLDMGTDFDDFRDLAQPVLEHKFLASGALSAEQLENRLLLRGLMERQGFKVLDHEWWHFNALPKDEVIGHHPILE